MKNSLLENLGADYVRTAFAKGLSEKRVIFVHALRNSLIPITAGIGHAVGILFAGSFLIETVCNIPGVLEVNHPPLPVLHPSLVKHLEEDLVDVGVGLLHLV